MNGQKKELSATLIIMIVNAIIFAVFYIWSFFNENIFNFIALQPSLILHGQYLWTLVTHMFMHANIPHLLVNMLSLMFLGGFTERLIGRKRFVLFYIISGIFAGIVFILFALIFKTDLNASAVGASGAIFAIGGLLAVLTPKMKVYIFFIPIPMPMWLGIAISLALMWVLSLTAGIPIGNSAHLGGLIAGLAYGFFIRIKHRKKVAVLDRHFR